TALAYQAERAAEEAERTIDTARHPYDYILTVLTPFEDPGLVVLPTHRLVRNVPEATMSQLVPALHANHFEIREVSGPELARVLSEPPGAAGHNFGLVLAGG